MQTEFHDAVLSITSVRVPKMSPSGGRAEFVLKRRVARYGALSDQRRTVHVR